MTTMVDSKIGKTFQRSVGRAKEKLLQNLGKVDRTADEILDEQIGNFNKQQGAATRLQKELNNYIRCIRACAAASRSLLESVGEVYEPEWGGKELLTVNAQSVELLWNDFAHRLAEQVLIPLNTYQGQFPEMRKKIEKRSRKLIDFDGERHALQALQANPRRAEAKLAKQRESLDAAKRTYEVLNSELHEELPSLYNSRIVFLVSAMSTLFASENIFHTETSKVFTELEGIVERLSKESAKGNLNFKVPPNAIMNHSGGADSPKDAKGGNTHRASADSSASSSNSKPSSPVTPTRPTTLTLQQNGTDEHKDEEEAVPALEPPKINGTPVPESPKATKPAHTNGNMMNGVEKAEVHSGMNGDSVPEPPPSAPPSDEPTETGNNSNTNTEQNDDTAKPNTTPTIEPTVDTNNNDTAPVITEKSPDMKDADKDKERSSNAEPGLESKSKDAVDNGPGSNAEDLPKANGEESPKKETPSDGDSKEPGVLYRVRATYKYQKEDVDELSFEAGEIIRVIEYEEPEEQEEGWLMGMKDNGEKGLFPANFTRPI